LEDIYDVMTIKYILLLCVHSLWVFHWKPQQKDAENAKKMDLNFLLKK